MILVLSPSKTLNENPSKIEEYTDLAFSKESVNLVNKLKKISKKGLEELMHISSNLAALNHNRFKNFSKTFTEKTAQQAIHMFKGDVYTGLDAATFSATDLKFAQKSIRILSGLYGVIRPLDLIQAYRLEMGTPFSNGHGKNLYEFWGDKVTLQLNKELKAYKSSHLLNLASVEYFKVIDRTLLEKPVIDIDFKEDRGGKLKVISFTAKKARGDMARQIVKYKIKQPEALKDLEVLGYVYSEEGSTDGRYLFVK